MGSEWTETTLGEFAPFSYGKGLKKEIRNENGDIPVYGSNGIIAYHDDYLIEDGIIIGRKGSIGNVHYSPGPFWPIDTTFYVESSPKRDTRFVYYLLKSLPLQQMNSDSAVPGLNRDTAHNLRIKVPPLNEQKRIAHILGTLDDKIELNQRMNETLEAMARALFKAWFVDFEPVKAKMNGEPYPLPDEIMHLFPDELVESELGPIPKGWRVGKLGDEFDITMGQSPPGSTYNEYGEGLPFYQGNRDFGFRFPKRRVYCTDPKRVAEPGDTLISVRAPIGDINWVNEKCSIGRGVASIRHKSNYKSFTYYLQLNKRKSLKTFEGEGTVFGSINKKSLSDLKIAFPPNEIIKYCDNVLSKIDKIIEIMYQQQELSNRLFSNLLNNIFVTNVEDR